MAKRTAKQFLTEVLKFDDAKATELAPLFEAENRADLLNDGFLAQQDYSRNMDALRAQQTQLTAANDALNAEMAEWATAKNQTAAEIAAHRDRVAELERNIFQREQVITRLATDAGVDPKTLLGDVPPADDPSKRQPAPQPVDLSGYVPRKDLALLTDYMLTLPAELAVIGQEHHALTGEFLDPREIVTEIKARAAKGEAIDPRALWEAKYKIPEKRTAANDAAIAKRIDAAREEGRMQERTAHAVPGAQTPGRHAPVFQTSNVTQGSHVQRPQPAGRISGAAAALADGRYKGWQPGMPRPAAAGS